MSTNPYESDKLLSEYLLFHYGSADDILPPTRPEGMADALDFAVRTPSHFADKEVERGLDLGCAVGRSSYEMSCRCREVTGIDFSHAFIRVAESLADGFVTYNRLDEAHGVSSMLAELPKGVRPERVSFEQGDAMHLRADLGEFDRVHAANLLCRLPEPQRLLDRLPSLVRSGGELVLATPCTWLGEFTPPENWPEGSTLDWLKQHLEADFELQHVQDEPFLIRETARKFQWTSSQLSLWRRR